MFCFLSAVYGSPMSVAESCFVFFLQTVVTFSKHKKFQKGLLVDQYKLNQL